MEKGLGKISFLYGILLESTYATFSMSNVFPLIVFFMAFFLSHIKIFAGFLQNDYARNIRWKVLNWNWMFTKKWKEKEISDKHIELKNVQIIDNLSVYYVFVIK